jgi:hypothetical protein
MTQDEIVVTLLHGVIAQMEPEHQKQIRDYAAELRAKVAENPYLGVAIGLVGAEIAAMP